MVIIKTIICLVKFPSNFSVYLATSAHCNMATAETEFVPLQCAVCSLQFAVWLTPCGMWDVGYLLDCALHPLCPSLALSLPLWKSKVFLHLSLRSIPPVIAFYCFLKWNSANWLSIIKFVSNILKLLLRKFWQTSWIICSLLTF